MEHLVQIGDTYVPRVWLDFLRHFLDWSDEQVAQWSIPYQSDLLDGNSVIYHDSLLREVVGLIVPDSVLRRADLSPLDKVELCGRLGRAVCGEGATRDPSAEWDWESSAHRVDEVLAGYGASLAEVNRTFRRFDIDGVFVPVR